MNKAVQKLKEFLDRVADLLAGPSSQPEPVPVPVRVRDIRPSHGRR